MKRQFTASTYLIDENLRILLLWHPKLLKWLPPGGHLEENETPDEAALREVFEETGLEIEWIETSKLKINYWNAKTLPHPFITLLEEIPPYKDEPAHQHVDFIFLAKPKNPLKKIEINQPFKWFTKKDLLDLKADIEIFQETLDVIESILLLKTLD